MAKLIIMKAGLHFFFFFKDFLWYIRPAGLFYVNFIMFVISWWIHESELDLNNQALRKCVIEF